MFKHINGEVLATILPTVRENFFKALPFPHLVIDEFLRPESFKDVLRSLPPSSEGHRSSDYIFAKNKFENPAFDASSVVLTEIRDELIGSEFLSFLRELYGKPVFVDPHFVGGGLHQGGEGSFLEMHADFSRHPVNRDWVRELNILLYLNRGYQDSWGGHLEIENAFDGRSDRIAPIGNRAVIMLTKAHTLHGYKPISFPRDRMRTSIAAYAYTVDNDYITTPDRSTLWRPAGRGIFKRAASKFMPEAIRIKRLFFGSSTARRAGAMRDDK